jgi:hypothetical protein
MAIADRRPVYYDIKTGKLVTVQVVNSRGLVSSDIPTIKGEKGDKGERGEKGDATTVSGMTSNPPAGYKAITNIYIDPKTGQIIAEYTS